MLHRTYSFAVNGLVASCIGMALLGGYWTWEFSTFYRQPLVKRFSELWIRDVAKLKQAGVLPPGMSDLKSIEISAATDLTQSWKPDLVIPFSSDAKGHFHLEILLLSWEEGAKEGAIVQYNLIDLRSKDMIWELGRTFVLLGENPVEEALARQIQLFFGASKSQSAL